MNRNVLDLNADCHSSQPGCSVRSGDSVQPSQQVVYHLEAEVLILSLLGFNNVTCSRFKSCSRGTVGLAVALPKMRLCMHGLSQQQKQAGQATATNSGSRMLRKVQYLPGVRRS